MSRVFHRLTGLAALISVLQISYTMAMQPTFEEKIAPLPKVVPGEAIKPGVAESINRYLDAATKRLLRNIANCKATASHSPGYWFRKVNLTSRGPKFFSFYTVDDVYCNGMHPDAFWSGLIFDLSTGKVLDGRGIQNLLPQFRPLREAGVNIRDAIVVESRLLQDYYVSHAGFRQSTWERSCLPHGMSLEFTMWMNANSEVVIRAESPYVAAGCDGEVKVTLSKLQ